MPKAQTPKDIDEYMARFPADVRARADEARKQQNVVEFDVAGRPLKGWVMIEAETEADASGLTTPVAATPGQEDRRQK